MVKGRSEFSMHSQKPQFEMAAWQDGAACIRVGPE